MTVVGTVHTHRLQSDAILMTRCSISTSKSLGLQASGFRHSRQRQPIHDLEHRQHVLYVDLAQQLPRREE